MVRVDVPSVIVSLLQEFEYMFLKDIPSGLPLLRRIELDIDLVPRVVIPNQLVYKSNLEEKELQRKVDELMNKGYIHKNMSLCAMPILLVLKKDGTWRMYVNF